MKKIDKKEISKAEIDLSLAIIARDLLYDHLGGHNKAYRRVHKRLGLLLKVAQENCHPSIIKELSDVVADSKEESAAYRAHLKRQLEEANRVIIKADAKKVKGVEFDTFN